MTARTAGAPEAAGAPRRGGLVATLLFIALVVAAIGSLGAPLITSVATTYRVSLAAAQWTLTVTLLTGAVAVPLLGRLGDGPRRRATVVVTLAVVVAGSVATVVPGPFWLLLAGRAAQGVGLGLTALMIAVARDHLAGRAGQTIALLSVASTAGIGVGYPLAGLLTELAGVRAAYALGLAVTAAALGAALLALPADDPARASRPIDWAGAGLLGCALVAVLLVTSDTRLWTAHPPVAGAVLAAGFSIGSATGGLVLAANTPPGHLLPSDGGYTTAALAGIAITALSIGVAVATGSRQRRLAARPGWRWRPDG